MRKQIAIILILFTIQNLFGNSIISLPYFTSDMVYSAKHDKLYALITAMDSEYGNRLVEINTSTGAIERSLFVGSRPLRMRLTSDENYVWLSLYATPFMKRIDLNSFVIDKKVYLGPSQRYLPQKERNSHIICYNFTVFPNENNKLAMGLKTVHIFDYEGIVLYRDDTILPKRILPYIDTYDMPPCIEPAQNSSYLIGYMQNSAESVFSTMKVVDDGLEWKDEFEGLIETNTTLIRNWIKNHNDTLFVAEGIVIDATDISALKVIGKCENDVIGDLYGFTFSEIHNAYVYPNYYNNSIYLTFYNRETFMAYDSVLLMKYQFNQIMLIAKLEVIDKHRFAIVVGKDYGTFSIRIIDTRATGIAEEGGLGKHLEVYPNPASDKLYINGLPEHKIIYVYDITGRLMNSWETQGLSAEISLGNLQAGTYLLKIIDLDNNSIGIVKKILVQ